MKKYLLLEMIIASFLFFSNDLMAQTLLVKPSLQIVQDKAGQTLFIITSDINWEVEVDDNDDDDWLEVNPTSGFGNDTLFVTFEKNDGNQPRSMIIEVEGGGITRPVTVTQLKRRANINLTVQPLNRIVLSDTDGTVQRLP